MTSGITFFAGHTRAFVKIQDGCNNSCSYCKVTLVRGKSRSRIEADIIKEAKALAKAGFKEIVLCGICLGAYKPDLIKLLTELEKIEGIERIRLSSIELQHVTSALIKKIAASKKLCPHLHIPLQSGDDKILRAMNRRYTIAQFSSKLKSARHLIPSLSFTTDIMVGFPGETDAAFKNTLKAIRTLKPSRCHIFHYSLREGTKAFSMKGQVSPQTAKTRAKQAKDLAAKTSLAYRKRFLGKTVPVLTHKLINPRQNIYTGYTDTYIEVTFKAPRGSLNKIFPVRITDTTQATIKIGYGSIFPAGSPPTRV